MLLEQIFKKIMNLTIARKVEWNTFGESALRASFGDYLIRLTKYSFSILDDDVLLDEYDNRTFLGATKLPVADLYDVARRQALKIDERLSELNSLLGDVDDSDDLPF